MADDTQRTNAPIIVKRVKKVAHAGHHGGSWKVAYADFVTAMMAFFLLMWLLNATSEEQKRGIADYFSPTPGLMRSTTGGEGFFAGTAITSDGKLVRSGGSPSVTIPLPTVNFEDDSEPPEEEPVETADIQANQAAEQMAADQDAAEKMLADLEEQQFAKAEHDLRQAIEDIPELQQLAENLIIDHTPEGLRIQIVDQEKYAMFPLGSAEMHDAAKELMAQVAKIVEKMPQMISITGHTDSNRYVNPAGYDNWDLSTDRANASRRALIEGGLSPARIAFMTGKAAQEPLFPDDPASPRNRRITIVLLREGKVAASAPDAPVEPGI